MIASARSDLGAFLLSLSLSSLLSFNADTFYYLAKSFTVICYNCYIHRLRDADRKNDMI